MYFVDILVLLGFALVGWGWCGAIMGVGRRYVPMDTLLWIHAAGAPLGFAALSWLYFTRFGTGGPLTTATVFVGVVVALDLFLVAPVFERSFAMFRSALGTWIPFLLIFLATWGVGRALS